MIFTHHVTAYSLTQRFIYHMTAYSLTHEFIYNATAYAWLMNLFITWRHIAWLTDLFITWRPIARLTKFCNNLIQNYSEYFFDFYYCFKILKKAVLISTRKIISNNNNRNWNQIWIFTFLSIGSCSRSRATCW